MLAHPRGGSSEVTLCSSECREKWGQRIVGLNILLYCNRFVEKALYSVINEAISKVLNFLNKDILRTRIKTLHYM